MPLIVLLLKIIIWFAYFTFSSTKTTPLFAYNEKLQGVLSRHRNPSEEKKAVKSCELKSHDLEVLESTSQCTKPLDFRLNAAESAGGTSNEKIDTDSTKDDNSHESSRSLSLPKDTKVILFFVLLNFDHSWHIGIKKRILIK